jgi:hypothetical protein
VAVWAHLHDPPSYNQLVAIEVEPAACAATDCGPCVSPPSALAASAAVCEGAPLTLDGSASLGCLGAGGPEFRWSLGATLLCNWSASPTCLLPAPVTGSYTLEVRCKNSPWCATGTPVQVTVSPDVTPGDLGNTLRAVRNVGDVQMAWAGVAEAATYTLHRSDDRTGWPSPPPLSGLPAPSATLPDVPPPPALWLYRAAGVSCSGAEGP